MPAVRRCFAQSDFNRCERTNEIDEAFKEMQFKYAQNQPAVAALLAQWASRSVGNSDSCNTGFEPGLWRIFLHRLSEAGRHRPVSHILQKQLNARVVSVVERFRCLKWVPCSGVWFQ
jgi:hypothetical protein